MAGFLAGRHITTGNGNVILGDTAGDNISTADDVICIGDNIPGQNLSHSCYIGFIFGETAVAGAAVYVNSNGKLATNPSSSRFKRNIQRIGVASEALFSLQPVSFQYNKELDPSGVPQFGLVAEEVEKVNPDLVVRDKEGKAYSVRYEQVNAMLLNEFLKEHRAFLQEQGKVEKLEKQVAALTAGLQKVSAQLATASSSLADLD